MRGINLLMAVKDFWDCGNRMEPLRSGIYGFDGELNGGAVIEAASIPMFGGDVSTDILVRLDPPRGMCPRGTLSPDSLC